MSRKRSFNVGGGSVRAVLHGITLVVAGLVALFVLLRSPGFARSQQLGEGMARTGIVGIQNDAERKLFGSLICTCGCPRETLGTCTCAVAHERRDELRAQLEAGRSIEDIQATYVARYGPEGLAVPPNKGSQRLLYLLPLGAGIVIVTLRRWRNVGGGKNPDEEGTATGPAGRKGVAPGARDDYDEKLDEELKSLDRE
jgi:cytochrome c-type biogenesis protein CcmH